jgi:hypothetical protein
MFEVHSQDYRGWRGAHFDRKPPVTIERFATKEAAEEAKVLAQARGQTACVVPAKPPRAKRVEPQGWSDFDVARKDWQIR